MNRRLFLCLLPLVTACHAKKSPDLSSANWVTVDSVFSSYVEKLGTERFRKGDLLGIELIGTVDKKTNQFIPNAQLDSIDKGTIGTVGEKLLPAILDKKVGRNSEGYLKADFGRFIPDFPVVINAYMNENYGLFRYDSIVTGIRSWPEVDSARFISKEEAKKEYLAQGHDDFSSVLDNNPLPESITISIKPQFGTDSSLNRLTNQLRNKYFGVFSDILKPKLYPELQKLKARYCIFRYKT